MASFFRRYQLQSQFVEGMRAMAAAPTVSRSSLAPACGMVYATTRQVPSNSLLSRFASSLRSSASHHSTKTLFYGRALPVHHSEGMSLSQSLRVGCAGMIERRMVHGAIGSSSRGSSALRSGTVLAGRMVLVPQANVAGCIEAIRPYQSQSTREPAGGKSSRSGKRGDVAVAAASRNGSGGFDDADAAARLALAEDTRVVPVELHKEALESYVSYAMSVIVGRALPDARDGLKPVHRRILFAMSELGLGSKKPFRKCARVVGEVLGKYHPHGDTAVYDALVRMAQSFSLRSPLVDGHGNFGSIDADPPAAMRYTECKLQPLAEAMLLEDISMDTVKFVSTFDGSELEPQVLPSRLPNLLINGTTGIAVGMATNIPPHNLTEVVDALVGLIRNPNATVQELMEYLPGPDFPTGGQIMGSEGLLQAYTTGNGSLVVRGKARIEAVEGHGSRHVIIISEIPYMTNKAALVAKIADLVNDKVLEGISDIRDESDRKGMRIVIEVKRGAMPKLVLNNLYKHTSLQTRFSCNMVGLVNGEPRVLTLRDFLQVFLDFRCNVVERRAAFQLRRAEEREHLVEGLRKALDSLDRVVATIRAAQDSAGALAGLQRDIALSPTQAESVLAMPLRRLTGLERGKLLAEHTQLLAEIKDLKDLLDNKRRVLEVVEKEAKILQKDFGTPRRTTLETLDDGELSEIDIIANDETLVVLSEKGYAKRMPADTFTAQSRGTTGKSGGKMRTDDTLARFFACRTHDHILFFSERGTVYSVRAYKIPEGSRIAIGSPIIQILALPPGEKITSMLPVSEFVANDYLVMLTSKGYIKRTSLSAFSAIRHSGIVAIQLEDGDELRWVRRATDDDNIIISSQGGMTIRFSCGEQLRPSGRMSRGVRAMKLKPGDQLAAMDILPRHLQPPPSLSDDSDEEAAENPKADGPWLLFTSQRGLGKRVPVSSFNAQARGGMGVRSYKLQEGDSLASLHVIGNSEGDEGGEVVIGSYAGILNRIRVRDISIQGRNSRGVKVMRLDDSDRVRAVSVISSSVLDEETAPDASIVEPEETQR